MDKKAFTNKCHTEGKHYLDSQLNRLNRLENLYRAFTLAEVLITLTIIGIIAALTIPNLMQQWQKEATVTKVKKGYNAINRMATNIKMNTNCNDLECTGILDIPFSNTNPEEFLAKFVELAGIKDTKVKTTKDWGRAMYMYCETQACTDTKGDPFHAYISTQDNMGYYVTPYTRTKDNKTFLGVYLFTETKPNKDGYSYFKKGRNTFYFAITDDLHAEPSIPPEYVLSESLNSQSIKSNINNLCTPQSGVNIYSGNSCAAKIILDGWKINY